jgi:protein-S-isoprenylcysteine O-methyltransferase Ste14
MANNSTSRISLGNLVVRLLALLVVLAGLLFIPAGRLDWLQVWLFILAFGGFLLFYGIWGLRNDPAQLAERSRRGENAKSWDRIILAAYTVLLVAMLISAGLDAGRFGWAPAPLWLQVTSWLGLALAGGIVWWTASVNTYLSRVVRIQDDRGQQVITTGPYRYVRHPMYVGVILMVLSLPLALGSLAALLPGALIAVLFVIRTALEDRTLQAELPGYAGYAQRVRYRLVPGVW